MKGELVSPPTWISAMRDAALQKSQMIPGPLARRWTLRAATILLGCIVISYLARSAGACRLPVQMDPATHQKATWCWEFWLQRYQTLLGVFVAIGAATIAYREQTSQQRERRAENQAEGRRFMRRLVERDSRIQLALADIMAVDDVLVQHTQDSIRRGETHGMERFDRIRTEAEKSARIIKSEIIELQELVFQARDEEIEGYLSIYTGFLGSIVQRSGYVFIEAKRQIDELDPPPGFERHLPSIRAFLVPARDVRSKLFRRCSELAGEKSWAPPPDDLWP